MSLKIQIYDGATPMLDKIATIHYEMGLDVLDHAGQKMRKSIRSAFRGASNDHFWHQKYVDGKVQIWKGTTKYKFGSRLYHIGKSNSADPENMANFINSWLQPKHMQVVVAGKHKGGAQAIRRDGKTIGMSKKISGVSKSTYRILQKLNEGGKTDGSYDKLTRTNASYEKVRKSMFKNPTYRARKFIEVGRNASLGEVKELMTNTLEKLIQRQVNRVQVKMKQVA
jgi:hypothetical protein